MKVVKLITNDGWGAGICFKLSQNNPESCQMLKVTSQKKFFENFHTTLF
jgi:hypothetical protein